MFKKMLPWLIMIIVVITLIVIAGFLLWEFIMKEDVPQDPNEKAQSIANQVEARPLTAKEREDLTYNISDVTTNLSDIRYIVKISFSFVLENKLAREELELIDPVVRDIIGNTLSDTTADEITGSNGKDALKATLINRINPRLNEGNLREINLSDFIITQSQR